MTVATVIGLHLAGCTALFDFDEFGPTDSSDAGPDAGPSGGDAGRSDGAVDAGEGDAGPPVPPLVAPRLALTDINTCLLRDDGRVVCWGGTADGQAGINERDGAIRTPTQVRQGAGPLQLARADMSLVGYAENLCARSIGAMFCWGDNEHRQAVPMLVTHQSIVSTTATQTVTAPIAVGRQVVCWTDGRDVACVGDGTRGALSPLCETANCPRTVVFSARAEDRALDGASIRDLEVGDQHGCAVTGRGRLVCWGRDVEGQLGRGRAGLIELAGEAHLPPVGDLWAEVALGRDFTCSRTVSGRVFCWGFGDNFRLGPNFDGTRRFDSFEVTGLGGPATQITAGAEHACAIAGGTIRCWGRALCGELGDGGIVPGAPLGGAVADATAPLADATEVRASEEHTCAIANGGQVFCWGRQASARWEILPALLEPAHAAAGGRPKPWMTSSPLDPRTCSPSRWTRE